MRIPSTLLMLTTLTGCSGPGDAPGGSADMPGTASTTADPTGDTPTTGPAVEPTTLGPAATTGAASTGDVTSSATGPAGACGDGWLDPGEICDDGAGNDPHGACTPLCKVNVCGDGFVHAGVEVCDEGAANVDTGYCRSDCQLHACGDGFRYPQLEACDDGAQNGPAVYNGCDDDCTINRCGDGELDVGHEECDDGAGNGAPPVESGKVGCSLECGLAGRRIFLSSQVFTGDMGTRAGADLACQTMAAQAGFRSPKRYRALLADASGAPADYVEEDPEGRPFILPSGLVVAVSYAALIDQGPGDGITMTETGEKLIDRSVWTNLNPFGAPYLLDPEHTCAAWTTASPLNAARIGRNAVPPGDPAAQAKWQAGRHWLSFATKTCSQSHRIYCIEARAQD